MANINVTQAPRDYVPMSVKASGQSAPFKQSIAKPKVVGPEFNPWYWNPFRSSVKFGPESFRERLKREMGDELEVTWNPIQERWTIWSRAPRMAHPICNGWRLLFIHNGPSGEYADLDERVFARLWSCSAAQHGDGKRYFARIQAEMERDREAYERKARADAVDAAMPYFEHSKIKNIGKGNKFSTYLA